VAGVVAGEEVKVEILLGDQTKRVRGIKDLTIK
jgi:hypothetical protein